VKWIHAGGKMKINIWLMLINISLKITISHQKKKMFTTTPMTRNSQIAMTRMSTIVNKIIMTMIKNMTSTKDNQSSQNWKRVNDRMQELMRTLTLSISMSTTNKWVMLNNNTYNSIVHHSLGRLTATQTM
jgi:hypothetical protein